MKARLDYYYCFIYPFLTYNIIVWGSTFPSLLNKLIAQHKRTIRVLDDLSYNEHTSESFRRLNLLKFDDIYKYHASIYMFKNINNPLFQSNHDLNTRNVHSLQPAFNRLSICQHSINYRGPHIWNSLPREIRGHLNLNSFKRALKRYFIDSYV